MSGLANFNTLRRDIFIVEITLGSVKKPCNECFSIKSLCVDKGIESPIIYRLTIGDLKYRDNISSIITPIATRVLAAGMGTVGDTGNGVGVVAIGETEGEVLTSQTSEGVLIFFCTKKLENG